MCERQKIPQAILCTIDNFVMYMYMQVSSAYLPEDVMFYKLQEATDRLSYNSGPQMPHVHLLGYVGGGEVHHDSEFPIHGWRSNAIDQDIRD